MQTKDQYKKVVLTLAAAVILAIQTGIFAVTWFRCYGQAGAHLFVRGNYVLIGLYGLMAFFFYHVFGGFKVGHYRPFEILYSQILSIVFANAVSYIQLCLICRWQILTNLGPIGLMTLVQLVCVPAWSFLFRFGFRKLYPPRKMLLVYGSYSPDELIRKIATREDRYHIQDTISIDADPELIRRKILAQGCVVLTDIPAQIRNEILKFCYEQDVRCYCVPKISDVMIRSADTIHLMDTTLLLVKNQGLTADQKALKRTFDVLASVAAIVVLSPVMALIALAVKCSDGGPVLFKQDRLTEGGKVFRLYKFRSMRCREPEEGYVLTRKGDSRITPVGRILRNVHLDELPQLFNILRGDMSFVGPRPECPALAEEYCRATPQFSYRLKVKAGLTGYAQVYGKYNSTPYDKLKLDLHYIENYSFWLDLKLLLLTVKILFQKENTEGIDQWQTSAERQGGQGMKR